jgi:glycosyltransferase involved in cell wall biosynthesis
VKSRACVVSQRYYPGDARLSTEITALQEAGFEVDVVCMRAVRQPHAERQQGVSIIRLPSLTRKRAGKLRYVLEYASFFLPCLILLAALHLRKRYRAVHVTNLPDALVFAALVPKLLGARLIFDLRECTPEMFLDRFEARPDGRLMKLMIKIEQLSIRFADAALVCTEQMRQAVVSRGADPAKISVMLNVGSTGIFLEDSTLPDPAQNGAFRIVTHGTIIRRYGHEVLIRAMAQVAEQALDVHLDIFGRGELQSELERLVDTLGLSSAVTFWGYVPDDDLLRHLRAAHCGIVPVLRTAESDLIHTYKMFEYITLGLPVICSRTTAVEAYFDDTCLSFFESGSDTDLARAILELRGDPAKRRQLARNALNVYQRYAPAQQRASYRQLLNRLLQPQAVSLQPEAPLAETAQVD